MRKRIESDDKTVLYVVSNRLKTSLRTTLLQKDPQINAQLLEYGTIIEYATLANPIYTPAPTIMALQQELHQITMAIPSTPPQTTQISSRACEWHPSPSLSVFAQHPLTYQVQCSRSHTLEHTANNFDANHSMESQDEKLVPILW